MTCKNCGCEEVELLLYIPGIMVIKCPKCGLLETQVAGGLVLGKPLIFPIRLQNLSGQKEPAQFRIPEAEVQRDAEVADLKGMLLELNRKLKEKGII